MAGLDSLLKPQSIAVIGASGDIQKIRGRIMLALTRARFPGRLYPVNPSSSEVQGLKAYPSIDAVPEKVDLAIIAVGADHALGALEACASAGVGAAIVFASGFAEGGDAAGQAKMSAIAARTGMRILGPNALGIYNERDRFAATFTPIITERVRNIPEHPLPGNAVDIVSQSGGLGFALFMRAQTARLPVRYTVTTGNEADCEAIEVAEHLIRMGGSSAMLLFIEGFKHPDRLAGVARLAAERGVPLVVTKIGKSDAGHRAAVSHTAHLTGADEICQAVFDRLGIIRVDTPEQIIAVGAAMAALPPPRGNRVAVVTTSGGGGSWSADIMDGAGLDVPMPSDGLRAEIEGVIPGFGSAVNPIDVTASVLEDRGLALTRVIRAIAESGEYDMVHVIMSLAEPGRVANVREAVAPLLQSRPMPIVFSSAAPPTQDNLDDLQAIGGIHLQLGGAGEAFRALAAYGRFVRRRALTGPEVKPVRPRRSAAQIADAIGPAGDRTRVTALLDAYGIPLPRERVARSAEEAASIADAIGAAVALKIESADIAHKTDAGGVILGVAGGVAAREAFSRILANVASSQPAARIDGVLVQEMAPPGIEMVVGMTRDPDFGPMIMLGLGGVYVELLRDTAIVPAPISEADAYEMVDRLKGSGILKGARGRPKADVAALARVLVGLSDLVTDGGEEIAEIDLNPVIVYPEGKGALVVDHLIVPTGRPCTKGGEA